MASLGVNVPLLDIPLGAEIHPRLPHSVSLGQAAKPFFTLLSSLAKWGQSIYFEKWS